MWSWVQVTLGVTLSNVTSPNNLLLNYMFYMFLICIPIFMTIGYNLLFDS